MTDYWKLPDDLIQRLERRAHEANVTTEQMLVNMLNVALDDELPLLKLVSDYASHLISIHDPDGNYLYVNPAYERLLGYEIDELLDTNPYTLFHPDDIETIRQQSHAQALAGKQDVVVSYRHRDAQGDYIWLESTTNSVQDSDDDVQYLVVITREINARRSQEDELYSRARLLDFVSDAVIATDLDFNVTFWNQAATTIYGWRADEVIGQNLESIFQTQYVDAATEEEALQALLTQGQWTGEFQQQRKDGTPIAIDASVSTKTNQTGEPVGFIAVNRDITHQKRDELALSRYAQRLEIVHKLDQDILMSASLTQIAGKALYYLRSIIPFDAGQITTLDTCLCSQYQMPVRAAYDVRPLLSRGYATVDNLAKISNPSAAEMSMAMCGVTSYVNVTLRQDGQTLGLLHLAAAEADFFDAQRLEIIAEVAHTLSIAFSKQALNDAVNEKNDEISALYRATTMLFDAMSVSQLAQQIVQAVVDIFEKSDCGIILLDDDGETLRRLARNNNFGTLPNQPFQIDGPGLVPYALRTGSIVYEPDVRQAKHYVENIPETRSEIVFPLTTPRGIIGALDLQSPVEDAFSTRDHRIIYAFAQQAASALDALILYEEVQAYADKLEERVRDRTAQMERINRRMEAILNNSGDAIVLADENGLLEQANPAFNRLFAYSIDEMSQLQLNDLFTEKDANWTNEKIQYFIDRAGSARFELNAIDKHGNTFDIDMTVSALNYDDVTGVVCNLRDITERKQAERALIESNQRFRGLFDRNNDAVFILGLDLNIQAVNTAAAAFLGYPEEELIGSPATDYIISQEEQEAQSRWAYLVENAILPIYERTFQRADGSTFVAEVNLALVYDADGAPLHIQSIVHDIDQRKQAEADLRRAIEQEKELSEIKSQFVSIVAHEFRSPLTVISNSGEILERYDQKLDAAKRRQYLERIRLQVRRLVGFMDEVLVLSEGNKTGLRINAISFDVVALCRDIIEENQINFDGRTLVLDSTHPEHNVTLDENLLRIVINNLITNALKYSPEGEAVHVAIICDDHLTIRVTDHGIGIPQADQEKLFENFRRASNVGTIQGTGIGLALSKMIVEAHEGEITFESQEKIGTTFIIHLPLHFTQE